MCWPHMPSMQPLIDPLVECCLSFYLLINLLFMDFWGLDFDADLHLGFQFFFKMIIE